MKGRRGRRMPRPTELPREPGDLPLSLILTHFPAQMKGFVLLRSAALISHQHISSRTQFTSLRFFLGGAFHLVQRRKR